MSTNTTEAPVRPELSEVQVTLLRELSANSKVNGSGEAKLLARRQLDLQCAAYFNAGITLSRLAAALGVTESSVHTRIVRVRAADLAEADAPRVGTETVTSAPVEVVETPKARKNRLARERRARRNAEA